MKTMYDIYTPDNSYRGQFDDEDKAINYAMRHNYIVVNRITREIVWSLHVQSPVYGWGR